MTKAPYGCDDLYSKHGVFTFIIVKRCILDKVLWNGLCYGERHGGMTERERQRERAEER